MDLSGIISISGKPGLFKVIAQGKNSIIVESLIDKKRFPAYATDRISALEDISIYTYDDDKPLLEIFEGILKKSAGKEAPSHKEDINVLRDFLSEVLPDYDEDRVYPSDIKKLFQWFNLLHKCGVIEVPKKKKAPAKDKKPSTEKKEPVKGKKEPAKTKKADKPKTPAKKVSKDAE